MKKLIAQQKKGQSEEEKKKQAKIKTLGRSASERESVHAHIHALC